MGSFRLIAPSRKISATGIREVAVAIALVRDSNFHLGCYYRDPETNSVFLLDLPRHGLVRRQDPQGEYAWADTQLSYIDLKMIANVCAAIYARYAASGLNFALNYIARFSQDYSLTVEGSAGGFTCATFVLAIFEFAGIYLLKTAEWPSRPGDRVWQQQVLKEYTDARAPQEILDQISSDVGCVRYRPEEVLAASTLRRHPASIKKVKPLAEKVVAFMKKLAKPLRAA